MRFGTQFRVASLGLGTVVVRPAPLTIALILFSALANIAYLFVTPFDLAPDEAHYWDWSRHLDWSYYSKGPLVAWLIRGSCELFGQSTVAVRLPAVVGSMLLLFAMFQLARRTLRSDFQGMYVIVFALILPPISAGAVLMTIDSPFLCCWAWALWFVQRAIFEQHGASWGRAGVVLAIGTLTKYTMLGFPVLVGLFLVAEGRWQCRSVRNGYLLMTGIGCLGLVPIVWWNATHDALGIRHLFGQAGLAVGPKIGFKWHGPFDYLAGQFGFLAGYWFCVWVAAVWTFRPSRVRDPQLAYLWWLSVPMVLALVPVSLRIKVQPNWPAAAYLPGFVLIVAWLMQQARSKSESYRRIVRSCLVLGVVSSTGLSLMARYPQILLPVFAQFAPPPSADRLAPVRNLDPTARLRGWRTLAKAVDELRAGVTRQDGQKPLIATMVWTLPGELGFYCQGNPQVFSFGAALSDRASQYDVWRPNPIADAQAFRGRSFVYVGEKIPDMDTVFERYDGPYRVEYRENGVTVGGWKLWVGRGYRGFPQTGGQHSRY